jgi:hypothetical protein
VWLSLKHVVALYLACCRHKLRTQFITLAYGQFNVFVIDFSRLLYCCVNPLLRWALTRGAWLDSIRISKATYSQKESLHLLDAYLTTTGSAIRRISSIAYRTTDHAAYAEALLLAARRCTNVTHFKGVCYERGSKWDECLVALTSSCSKLADLSLHKMQLSGQGLSQVLRQCVALESFEVTAEDQVIPVEVAIPSLKSLKSGSRCITDAVLMAIGQYCAKLETLHVFKFAARTGDSGVSDVRVRAVLEGCPLLRETDVEYAGGISDDLRVELARRLSLTSIDFKRWTNRCSYLAQEVLKASPNLTSVRFWIQTSDATLAVCAQHCPQLRELDLSGTRRVTAAGVRALLKEVGSKLCSLDLRGCKHFGDEMVLAVAEHCPLLERFQCSPHISVAARRSVGMLRAS